MKDEVLDDAMAALGIDANDLSRPKHPASKPASQSPAATPARQAPVVPANSEGTERQLGRIFVLLALALAIYVGQSLLYEWRYQEARQELSKAAQKLMPGRR